MTLIDETRRLFMAGLAAADPGPAVRAALRAAPVAAKGKLALVAVGKAAVPMARAAQEVLGPLDGTLVVTNPENATGLPSAQVFAASHPVPDAVGLEAGKAVGALASSLGGDDHLLVLMSGGGSALLPAPAPGLTLDDKIAVNQALLACGAPIEQMNLVRQNLSQLKGGGLVRLTAPAQVTALILSDVVGDDLRAVASGPTAPPMGTPAEAVAVLQQHGAWDGLPDRVRKHLADAQPPQTPLPPVDNRLIGSNSASLAAMAAAAPQAHAVPAPLEGLVEDAAAVVLATAQGSGTWLWGGETTVILKGTGKGGRNQHLALTLAVLAEQARWSGDWAFLSGGTDGRDGPTDAAGAIVGPGTLQRIRDAGIDPTQALANNDSYTALRAADALLMTGGTGTNVADLQVLIRA